MKRNLKQNSLFKIAIYVRVSTEEQAENPEGSIKNQEQRIREFIKLKNIVEPYGEVTEVFSDPGFSAKDTKRPGFQRMLSAIQVGQINLVMVTELSRFSRSTKDFAGLQEFLKNQDCKFLSLRENFDTSGAAGSMVMNMMATIAEFERRQTAERISNAFLARSKRGLYNGGSLPIGYRIDQSKPGHLFVDPEEAEIVKLAFAAFLKEGTVASAAKFLTANNIRTPKKVHGSGAFRINQFTVDSLYRLLKNKAYIGVRVFQTKAGEDQVAAVWEAIIDKDTFSRANELLKKNCHHKKTHRPNRYPYTLSGLIFCSKCGDRMSGKSAYGRTGNKIGYYEHIKVGRLQSGNPEKILTHSPNRVPSEKIEPFIWQEVRKFILTESFAKELLEKAKSMQISKNETDEFFKVQSKLKITINQIEVLAERISALPKEFDLKPFLDQLSRLQKLKSDQEQRLHDTESKNAMPDEAIHFETLEIFRKDLRKLINKGEIDKNIQSAIIKKVVHKIIILPEGFEIHFHIGKTYYQGLRTENLSPVLFSLKDKANPSDSKKSAGLGQNQNFFKNPGSSLLTNGEPRMTRDMDIVIDIRAQDASKIEKLFPLDGFYCPPTEVLTAEIIARGQFNLPIFAAS